MDHLPESLPLVDRGSCPICRDARHEVVHSFPGIPVVKCGACGFMYSQLVFSAEFLGHYYAEQFGSERHRQGQVVNAATNRRIVARLRRPTTGSRLLDVGCGYGYFARAAIDTFGVAASGVEVSRPESKHAREVLGIEVHAGGLDDVAAALPRTVDLVTNFEVIEHVLDPTQFLQQLAALARPGGHVLVGTDNFGSAVARRMGAGFPKWIPHSHISHFDAGTFRALFARVPELEVVATASFTPWELMALDLRARLSGRRVRARDFDLRATMATENATPALRGFALRRGLSPAWATLSLRDDLEGALMYVLARKR